MECPTDDHIPAKNLFPKPHKGLMKVPSCKSCNEGFHLDDDYLWMLMHTFINTSEHPELLRTKDKFIRSMHRKEGSGFRQLILNNTSWNEIYSEGGIYLGNAPVQNIDWRRIERVIGRVVKGLFYKEKGVSLSPDSILEIRPVTTSSKEAMTQVRQLLTPLLLQNETVIGNNVFSYRFIFNEEDTNQTAWLLTFYQNFYFLGSTFSKA